MALSILDGNQSATTLSTILTSGQHITAHTVVSLGTQAITDISGAVSGSVVSISNFPATQPVSIASVTIGNSVTIGSLPAISGTVTANSNLTANALADLVEPVRAGVFAWADSELQGLISSSTPIISGTVTLGASTAQIGSVTASISGTVPVSISSVTVGNSVTIGSLPAISGTVTANVGGIASGVTIPVRLFAEAEGESPSGQDTLLICNSAGGLIVDLRSGGESAIGYDGDAYLQVKQVAGSSVTIGSALPAGTAQIGSVTASISGTVPISISSVTVGNSVTIGSLPAISGTVTANLASVVTADIYNVAQSVRVMGTGNDGVILQGMDAGDNSRNIFEGGGIPVFSRDANFPISGTVTAVNHQGTTVTTSNFTSTTASTTLASANAGREVLTIFNEGAGLLFVCPGATCTTVQYQVRLAAFEYFEVPLNQTSLTHSAVFATAGTARVTEIS